MPILDTGTATHAGTITLTVQVRMDAAGSPDAMRGEVFVELRDASQVVVTNIRNAVNTEIAG